MRELVTRRFTADRKHIYFNNKGIISRKKITDFIKEQSNVYVELSSSDKSVGWCTAGMSLMFTENSEIYHVSTTAVRDLLEDGRVFRKTCNQNDIITVQYYLDDYEDESLIVDDGYKDFSKCERNAYHIGVLPSRAVPYGRDRYAFVQNDAYVYSVFNGEIHKQHVFDCIACNGIHWKNALKDSGENTGFSCFNPGYHLVIGYNEIYLMNKENAEHIINHWATDIDDIRSSITGYIILEVYRNIFDKGLLIPSLEYKKSICTPKEV